MHDATPEKENTVRYEIRDRDNTVARNGPRPRQNRKQKMIESLDRSTVTNKAEGGVERRRCTAVSHLETR